MEKYTNRKSQLQLAEVSENKHTSGTATQNRKEDILSTPKSFPSLVPVMTPLKATTILTSG